MREILFRGQRVDNKEWIEWCYIESVVKNSPFAYITTNGDLTEFLIKLSAAIEGSDEKIIGSYFHVLNDLERVADYLVNVGYSIVNPIGSQKRN